MCATFENCLTLKIQYLHDLTYFLTCIAQCKDFKREKNFELVSKCDVYNYESLMIMSVSSFLQVEVHITKLLIHKSKFKMAQTDRKMMGDLNRMVD